MGLSSSLLGPIDHSSRALAGHLKSTVRCHTFHKNILSHGFVTWTLLGPNDPEGSPWCCKRTLISQKVFIKSFYKSQFPQKSVNISSIITYMKDKWTDLCGNWLWQNDFINTVCWMNPDLPVVRCIFARQGAERPRGLALVLLRRSRERACRETHNVNSFGPWVQIRKVTRSGTNGKTRGLYNSNFCIKDPAVQNLYQSELLYKSNFRDRFYECID